MTDTAAPWPRGDALAADLRRALGLVDPVPEAWRDAATDAFAWAAVDAAPARLEYDSRGLRGRRAHDQGLPGTEVREVRYVAGDVALALELDVGADKLRLLGRIEPPGRVVVVLAWPEGRWDGESDDDGTFRVDELPRRPFCVVVDGARPVKSGWVVP
ncbi:MAG TPA: hypothetical protein VFP06_16030 [Acidimicrobiales bacterium]|nr:hypothetical protein [Acidimicrobiales bacterium]